MREITTIKSAAYTSEKEIHFIPAKAGEWTEEEKEKASDKLASILLSTLPYSVLKMVINKVKVNL